MRHAVVHGGFIGALSIAALACSADGAGGDVELATQAQALGSDEGWRMASHDEKASGNDDSEEKIGPGNVGGLEVKWVFNSQSAGFPVAPVHVAPVTDRDGVFFGTSAGQFISLDREGNLRWVHMTRPANPYIAGMFQVESTPILGSAVIPDDEQAVIYGDLDGNIYALDRETGEEIWAKAMNPHPLGGVIGNSLLVFGDTVVVGMSAIESYALGIPGYPCCTHRGFVVALDVATGQEKWRYTTIGAVQPLPRDGTFALPDGSQPFVYGPSGADVWGQPTYDRETNTVFFGTGQNFSPKAEPPYTTDTSDAIIAVDATTGQEKWKRQLTSGDIWVQGVPNPNVNPATGTPIVPWARTGWLDMDIGDSPKIYRLEDGRKVVGAGQKSGDYHVLDAATGAVIQTSGHITPATALGGFQAGGGFAGDTVFQHGMQGLPSPPYPAGAYYSTVIGMSLDGTVEKWRFNKPVSLMAAPLAIANDVVYVVSSSEEPRTSPPSPMEWALYGLDAKTGAPLSRVAFPGRALTGAAVDRGLVYIGMGNSALPQIGTDMAGGLAALGPSDDE